MTTQEIQNLEIDHILKYREELDVHHEYFKKLVGMYDNHQFMSQWEHGLKMIETEIEQNKKHLEAAQIDLELVTNLINQDND
jgi:soluble cytochrome b562